MILKNKGVYFALIQLNFYIGCVRFWPTKNIAKIKNTNS